MKFLPTKTIKNIETIVTSKPTYEKSKKPNPVFVIVDLYSEIMILGGVPITVFMPPKIHAKARGIRCREDLQPIF